MVARRSAPPGMHLRLAEGVGTGKASAPYTIGTSITMSGPGCRITGDLNGDGIPDLLFGEPAAAQEAWSPTWATAIAPSH